MSTPSYTWLYAKWLSYNRRKRKAAKTAGRRWIAPTLPQTRPNQESAADRRQTKAAACEARAIARTMQKDSPSRKP